MINNLSIGRGNLTETRKQLLVNLYNHIQIKSEYLYSLLTSSIRES